MSTVPPSKPTTAVTAWVILGLLTAVGPLVGQGNYSITTTGNGTLAASAAFGSMTPAKTTAATSRQVQFRLRSKDATGYHVNATATFTPTTTGAVAGGTTISASDIGVGITSIAKAAGVNTPRTDTILSGFSYDPSAVTASTGVTPYLGAALGQATLADLSTSKKLLSGPQIDTVSDFGTADYLTVTMKFGLVPQYFTPGSFTAVVTLTILTGP